MKLLYCRVSTLNQKTDRQRISEKDYSLVIEDKCSGATAFFDREGGRQIKKLLDKGVLTSLAVWTIDRLGRDLRDILNTIHVFSKGGIAIHFLSQGLVTLDEKGKENPVSKLMISILGIVGEMERSQIQERQLEGIQLAKLKGVYKGRVQGSREGIEAFLSKKGNKEALAYLKRGYKAGEVAKITGLHPNTITKIKKLGVEREEKL